MPDIEDIRKAIRKNRAGFNEASDGEIKKIWCMLPPDTQEQYLSTIKQENKKNAVSNRTRKKIPIHPDK